MSGSSIAAVNTVSLVSRRVDNLLADSTIAEETGGTFQIRPHREFVAEKGREKILSLELFSHVSRADPYSGSETLSGAGDMSHSGQAYSFMQRRQQQRGEPSVLRRHGMIRLANYSDNDVPLCVSDRGCAVTYRLSNGRSQMSSVGALLDHLSRVQASGDLDHEGIGSLDVQNIELLAL